MKKTFGDVIRVFLVIDVFMMPAMVARPQHHRIFERGRAKDEGEKTHRQRRAKCPVRKQSMITECDAESGWDQQHHEQGELEPINAEIPQVKRHRREGQNKRADQERARRPVDAVCRDSKVQGKLPRSITHLFSRATENNVFLRPSMNGAAMQTSELLRFHLGCRPALFFDCLSGIGQL